MLLEMYLSYNVKTNVFIYFFLFIILFIFFTLLVLLQAKRLCSVPCGNANPQNSINVCILFITFLQGSLHFHSISSETHAIVGKELKGQCDFFMNYILVSDLLLHLTFLQARADKATNVTMSAELCFPFVVTVQCQQSIRNSRCKFWHEIMLLKSKVVVCAGKNCTPFPSTVWILLITALSKICKPLWQAASAES